MENLITSSRSTGINYMGLNELMNMMSTLKNAQRESCELSFIWGKMRTAARETAFQMALRNCSREVGGKVSIYVILVKGEYIQSSTYFLQKVSASHEEQSSP